MLKLIILNNSLDSIKNLCNHVFNELSDVQLSGMCTSIEELDNLIEKVKPHIIMMNYSDYIDSKYSKGTEFKKIKFIIYDSIQSSRVSTSRAIIQKNANYIEAKKYIAKLVSNENIRLLREKLIKWFDIFNFDFKLIGTTYLLETILYCYENREDYVFENLEKNVYPHVAKICKTTDFHVKWSILRSIQNMNNQVITDSQKQLSKILNLDIYEKITTKQLVSAIITKLN